MNEKTSERNRKQNKYCHRLLSILPPNIRFQFESFTFTFIFGVCCLRLFTFFFHSPLPTFIWFICTFASITWAKTTAIYQPTPFNGNHRGSSTNYFIGTWIYFISNQFVSVPFFYFTFFFIRFSYPMIF